MLEKEIARLVGTLKFNADYRPLINFEKKLTAVEGKMRAFSSTANKKITLKVGLDSRDLTAKLKVLGNSYVKFRNFDVDATALKELQAKIASKLDATKLTIKDIKIPVNVLKQQKDLMRSMLESTTIDLPVDVRMKAAERRIKQWKRDTEQKFKLHLEADISRAKFYRNVRKSVDEVIAKIGTVKLVTPKLQLKVDRQQLRAEIQAVLQEISRQAKIKIDLTGHVNGPAGGSRGAMSARHAALGGGVAGGAMSLGRGFIPGLGGAFAVSQLNQVNQQLQAGNAAATAVMGNETAGQEQLAWLRSLGNQVGFDYRQQTMPFMRMMSSGQNAGMSTDSVQNIFQGTAEYGRVMGLSDEDMKGSMRAIEQMLNKQQVYSEELKTQLAERMPGVISAMAEAVTGDANKTAELFELMEEGQVKSKDVLPKFTEILSKRARNGGALEKAMKATAAQQSRFRNSFNDAVKVFAEGGFDEGMSEFFRDAADGLQKALPLVKALGGAFEIMMRPVRAVIKIFGEIGRQTGNLAKSFGLSSDNMIVMGASALMLATPLGRMLQAISWLALAVEDFLTFLRGGESEFGDWYDNLSPEKQAMLDKFGEAVKGLGEEILKLGSTLFDWGVKLLGWLADGGWGWKALDGLTKIVEQLRNLVNVLNDLANVKNPFDNLKKMFSFDPKSLLPGSSAIPGMPGMGLMPDAGTAWKVFNGISNPQGLIDQMKLQTPKPLPGINQPINKVEKIEININGAGDPDAVGAAVDRHLQRTYKGLQQWNPEVE